MIFSLYFSEKLEAENIKKREKDITLTLKYDRDN